MRKVDATAAERAFASMCGGEPADALNPLLEVVDDATEVHRVVLVSRSWDLLDFVGKGNTHTLLRQSVRFCLKAEGQANYVKHYQSVRDVLPKVLDQHKLAGKKLGTKPLDDATLEKLSDAIFGGSPADAAGAAAAALADRFAPDAVGEAVAVAANQLVLRDQGRPKGQTAANKPEGSCHGDSIGVHACDSANAWRSISPRRRQPHRRQQPDPGGVQVASDRTNRGGDFLKWQPYPRANTRRRRRRCRPRNC